ncbi:hypothetical protein HII31_05168 [Pseudocercospora fuligena]|uniref:Uncharacterized protein n=1 Tax=Pseudocercospora fuligena TaxID=685502 RepID=A0A8H6RL71_9PEZI|nr:hypothetical protein HII31_05168 [Pseudocercospora fuligena]
MAVSPFTAKAKYYGKMVETYEKLLDEAEDDEVEYEELELKELEFREKLAEVQIKMARLRGKSKRYGDDGRQPLVRGHDEDDGSDEEGGRPAQGKEQQSTFARSRWSQEGMGQQITQRVQTDSRRRETRTASGHFGAPQIHQGQRGRREEVKLRGYEELPRRPSISPLSPIGPERGLHASSKTRAPVAESNTMRPIHRARVEKVKSSSEDPFAEGLEGSEDDQHVTETQNYKHIVGASAPNSIPLEGAAPQSTEQSDPDDSEVSGPEIKREDVSPALKPKQKRTMITKDLTIHEVMEDLPRNIIHILTNNDTPHKEWFEAISCAREGCLTNSKKTYGKKADAADLLSGLKGLYMHAEKLHLADFKRKSFGARTESTYVRFLQDEEFVARTGISKEEIDEIKRGNVPDGLKPKAAAKSRKQWPGVTVNERNKSGSVIDTSDVMSRLAAVAEREAASSKSAGKNRQR